jgi:hypothetical protein
MVSGSTTLTVTTDLTITTAYQGQDAWLNLNQKEIAVGLDGFPRIAVVDFDYPSNSFQIVYVRCLDADCSTSNTHAFPPEMVRGGMGWSIAVGPDGFARIAYSIEAQFSGPLNLIQCADDDCTNFTTTFVDTEGGDPGGNDMTSIVVGSDGTSYILYDVVYWSPIDSTEVTDLKIAACNSGGCSISTAAQVDSGYGDIVGGAIAMGSNGTPVMAYADRVANDVQGSPPSGIYYYANGASSLVSADLGGDGYELDLAVALDGSAKIVFPNSANNGINVASCSGTSCNISSTVTPQKYHFGDEVSMAIDPDGNPQIAADVGSYPNYAVDYVQCADTTCNNYREEALSGEWHSHTSLAIDPDGLPHILAQKSTPDGSNPVEHVGKSLSATLILNTDTVSVTDSASILYKGTIGNLKLGTQAPTTVVNNACVAGSELDAKVEPSTASGPITIKRFINSEGCWLGSNLTSCQHPLGDDTGDWFTTDPQQNTPGGNANGHVYNLDGGPGVIDPPSANPVRVRFNFVAYAVAPDGTKISPELNYYVRLSCQNNSSGVAEFVTEPDITGDNQIGLGTTKTTFDLK